MDNTLSKWLGSEETPTHLLTHAEWNSMPEYFSRGSHETGIRRLQYGKIVPDSFELIQHGWYDWQKAGEVIKRLLAKGKTPSRIHSVMTFIKDKGWVNRPPKARTL